MPTITVDDAKVHYEISGNGPKTVLVHGTGSGGAELVWGQAPDEFTEGRTIVLPDLSGARNTVDDGGELTVERLVGQIIAVVEDSGGGPADLVGFSLGGTLVAAAAARRPDLVRRVVSVAGFPHADHPAMRQSFELWRSLASDPERFGKFATVAAFSPGFLGGLDEGTLAAVNAGMVPDEGTLRHIDLDLRVDIRESLPRVAAPTLVIGNRKDGTVPVDLTAELAERIPGSTYVEFDSGHITFAEQPRRFFEEVSAFLR
ncbi:alpha/beta fold hydrolase [Glycomyces xiaoerkulensis]|uniref:alpha/beta fold hydrolase n=1 Tax=Glycomyces xiaoerkulensis TaxID=2038139 RepID=UPI000C262648|nr:alpha/beta hydrolase [Glycomyces xiaoerkulensis]